MTLVLKHNPLFQEPAPSTSMDEDMLAQDLANIAIAIDKPSKPNFSDSCLHDEEHMELFEKLN